MRPDAFEPDEIHHFRDLPPAAQRLVLAIRNLVISLWSLHPTTVLTKQTCLHNTLIRGLIRVAIPHIIARVMEFLTVKGIVLIP